MLAHLCVYHTLLYSGEKQDMLIIVGQIVTQFDMDMQYHSMMDANALMTLSLPFGTITIVPKASLPNIKFELSYVPSTFLILRE